MTKPDNGIPYSPYGPATGVPTPEPKNEALTPGSHYTGASKPGTAGDAHPGHAEGGPGKPKE